MFCESGNLEINPTRSNQRSHAQECAPATGPGFAHEAPEAIRFPSRSLSQRHGKQPLAGYRRFRAWLAKRAAQRKLTRYLMLDERFARDIGFTPGDITMQARLPWWVASRSIDISWELSGVRYDPYRRRHLECFWCHDTALPLASVHGGNLWSTKFHD